MSYEATETETTTTEETGETETYTTTEVSDETGSETVSTGTYETTEDTNASSTVESEALSTEDGYPQVPLAQDLLKLEGRHLKAEDFEWGTSPVANLADIIIEAVVDIESSDVETFLKNATSEQIQRIAEILPLDLPHPVTLPLIEEGKYWERMCVLEKSWPASDIWRHSDNWKSMFVHRSLQQLIENFNPEKDDMNELRNTINIYSKYVTSLQIRKLITKAEEKYRIDLSSEDFDQQLDDIILAPQGPVYLAFDRVFDCISHLHHLFISLSPKCLDCKDFHFNNADFNSLFRGLRKLKNLLKFRISNALLTNEQLRVILKMFLNHNALTELNLSYNFIDNDTCSYVAKLLISGCPLENLVLKCNNITDDGAKFIASALSENWKLKKLDLSLNMIGDEGGCFLAKVLLFNKSVVDLDLSKNKFKAESGVIFAELVRKTEDIKSFKLQENFFGETSGKLFLNAVTENHNILELDVHYCGFRDEVEEHIHAAILRNRLEVPFAKYANEKDIPAAKFLI